MIFIIAGLLAGILLAMDAQRNLGTGSATTMFRTYSRQAQPMAFWVILGIKLAMSAALAILSSALIVGNSA